MKLYTKLDSAGAELSDDATTHVALIDHTLNLMIDVRDTIEADHYDAPAAATAIDFLGFKDWRLQTPKELFSQVDHTRHNPYADVKLFPNVRQDTRYWTGQVGPEFSDVAFAVGFYYGSASWYYRDNSGVVRAVRSLALPAGQ